MFEQPVLFPAISNRETWLQTIQIADDETGDLILLTDGSGNPLYSIFLEISLSRNNDYSGGYSQSGYGDYCENSLMASLADYLSIPDTGTIQINIPYTVIQKLMGNKTYDVYLRLIDDGGGFSSGFSSGFDIGNFDARQLLIGRLPVYYGGRSQ